MTERDTHEALAAARSNDAAALQRALAADRAGAIAARAEYSLHSALHLAARHADPKCAELLLAAGADVEAENAVGNRPLHRAAQWGSMACVELLLRGGRWPRGAKRKRRDAAARNRALSAGKRDDAVAAAAHRRQQGGAQPQWICATALRCAREQRGRHIGAAAGRREYARGRLSRLHAAARCGRVGPSPLPRSPARARRRLQRRQPSRSPNAASHGGGWGFIECAEPLLNAGAEANARDVHGTTPLLCASYSSEFVTVLLRGGADPFLVPPRTAAAVDRARDSALLRLLLVGCARGGVFAPARLYDAALWRVVGRFALGGAEDCQW
jgi:hypothetical protein